MKHLSSSAIAEIAAGTMGVLVGAIVSMAAAETAPFELRYGDTVAFVGGTDMVRLQQDGRFEAALTRKFHGASPRFRDLSWDGDTVYFQSTVQERWRREAFGDWPEQLRRVGATAVIAQFGKIESLDGPDHLAAFIDAYKRLLDQLGGDGRRIALLAPEPLEWEHADASALPAYSRAIEILAAERSLPLLPAGDRHFEDVRPPHALVEAVREKHRLWKEYWRPSNWKCLFGDDSRRIFSNAAEGLPSLQEQWATYTELIAAAEACIHNGDSVMPREAPPRAGSSEADIADELAAFEVADGYAVNLFADDTLGIANPLSVRWDADGRMFVACSDAYPQIEPGVKPDDKIHVLIDADGDGRADSASVFADGLSIPTGMEVGHDGVYVGQNTELLLLGWNGSRTTLLSGFGNGDSHQTVNSFVWGPGGELWFCQGDGIESRVETPFGVSSLFQAGVFRLRPRELRLDGLLDDFMGPGNPWGIAFDDFGQAFVVDGAGGISYLTPGSIPVHRRRKLPEIAGPGGYCGVECLGAEMFALGDYKRNQVGRFAVAEDGAGFKVEWREPLLRSGHRNFRPIDVKLGPDGAIYVVDWYNPIICHQDDFYRHPDRDKTHGRIWRVAKVDAVRAHTAPLLSVASTEELLGHLQSPNRWLRGKASQVLAARGGAEVLGALRARRGPGLMQVVSVLEWMDHPDRPVLEQLLQDPDHRIRAYAVRVAGRWGTRIEDVQALLERAAVDVHPRVRMEAVLACAAIPRAQSVLVAAAAAEAPRDRWLDYAFAQAVHHLQPHWLPAFKRGQLDFGERREGLAAVLGEAGGKALLETVRQLLEGDAINGASRPTLMKALIAIGDDADLMAVLQAQPPDADFLRALADRERPRGSVAPALERILASAAAPPDVSAAAMVLAGRWQVTEAGNQALAAARDAATGAQLRTAAILTLGALKRYDALEMLEEIATAAQSPFSLRMVSVEALLGMDPAIAAQAAVTVMQEATGRGGDEELHTLFGLFAARAGAAAVLAGELGRRKPDTAFAERLQRAWNGTGLADARLSGELQRLAGTTAPSAFPFSSALAGELVSAAGDGDPENGKTLFFGNRAGCAACHQVGGRGGTIGPDLSAVGSGVPPERIVTEVMWPARQIKAGYALTVVTTRDGRVVQGYLQENRDESRILLRDFATGEIHSMDAGEVAGRDAIGSLMPATAQALSRGELADLFSYLFLLRGSDAGEGRNPD